ncbi:MAG: dihydropteroate synthase [Candidatus Desulfovibrio kirbyi]|jgi:dihydropteroate synthase|uniref:dihydropteroate synthase n=1 Tax=Candidatus Desulfovibrio kirbyi TaxID=2696086 RepID=A0A6L2R6A4_9BACT|nr:dihydropteroate synthase [Desulfovibrio sp.]GFH63065.1 MAG: dihydropteroate synthase [Candidatus Desulfovibrio kirbyi]
MGIVNVTPDSFYDGAPHAAVEDRVAHALRLLDQGADILDVGAESSRPGAVELAPTEELSRLLPVLLAIRHNAPGAVVSVDTYHAETAAAALSLGASVINDISACAFDPALLDILAQYKPGYVLTHSQGRPWDMQRDPRYKNVRSEVMTFFERSLTRFVRAGMPEDRIVLDPGIGFGKTLSHTMELLAHPEDWLAFGRPVLMGLSMKSMFGGLFGLAPDARGVSTQVTTALLWDRGVFWHRVHEVAGARHSLTLAAALRNAKQYDTLPAC